MGGRGIQTGLQALDSINWPQLADTTFGLLAAYILGALIGCERQYRQRTAGLRTNVLVAIGAALFVDMAHGLFGNEGAIRVAAYVVSGVGFLGAGVIIREQGNVRGLNTAATLWGAAAVGACAGANLIAEAVVGTVFVLAANTMLRPVVRRINRQNGAHAEDAVEHEDLPARATSFAPGAVSARASTAPLIRPGH